MCWVQPCMLRRFSTKGSLNVIFLPMPCFFLGVEVMPATTSGEPEYSFRHLLGVALSISGNPV